MDVLGGNSKHLEICHAWSTIPTYGRAPIRETAESGGTVKLLAEHFLCRIGGNLVILSYRECVLNG